MLGNFSFALADYSSIVTSIYDSGGTLVKHHFTGQVDAGVSNGAWDGTNNAQQLVPWGDYRLEMTATSMYTDIHTGQPVNTVTKSVWFTLCESTCQCGDANSDHSIDISDQVFLINYIFAGGDAPGACEYAFGKGDANGDCAVDISDAVYLIQYVFAGGAAPLCGTGCK